MTRKKEVFTIANEEGKDVEYAVVSPKPSQGREAQKAYNTAFAEAVDAKALLRKRLNTYMREQGLWSDEKETERDKLIARINELELSLQRGGIKLTEARDMAIEMRRVRLALRELLSESTELDTNTAEGQAENARFNQLVALCLVYNKTGEPVYKDIDDYLENGDSPVAFRGAQELANMMFQLDKNYDTNLPENKFLSKWKFVDEQLRLVNKDGHLIDTEGRLIDENGRYINDKGEFVDIDGNLLDDDGNYVVESSPFLDDDGNPIVEEVEEKKVVKKKTVKKKKVVSESSDE